LEIVKFLIDNKINVYLQKERIPLLDKEDKPSMFAPVMIDTLSTCAEIERGNIKFRLNRGRQIIFCKGVNLVGIQAALNLPTRRKRDTNK
jgi:hypothetical protein